MFKIPLEDFIEEIKAELFSYDEIEEEKIEFWEKNFLKSKETFKTVKFKNNEIILKDEEDLFEIADGFYSAILNEEEDKYWQML